MSHRRQVPAHADKAPAHEVPTTPDTGPTHEVPYTPNTVPTTPDGRRTRPADCAVPALLRYALPVAALVGANIAAGRLLTSSSRVTAAETALIGRLRDGHSPGARRAARILSATTDVPASIVHGGLAAALLWRRTREWRVAALPAAALVLETAVYLSAGAVVRRPRPPVPRLDRDQPTSSFPSGHQGAVVAVLVVDALLASRVRRPGTRAAIRVGCLSYPMAIAWSRVFAGMHYPSDVAAGTVNGVAAGLLAWDWLLRTHVSPADRGGRADVRDR